MGGWYNDERLSVASDENVRQWILEEDAMSFSRDYSREAIDITLDAIRKRISLHCPDVQVRIIQ